MSGTKQLGALTLRAIACRGWVWMDGLRTGTSSRAFTVETVRWRRLAEDAAQCADAGGWSGVWAPMVDFDDAGTKGCLLEMVRRAWDDRTLHPIARIRAGRWTWSVPLRGSYRVRPRPAPAPSECEALVQSLEAHEAASASVDRKREAASAVAGDAPRPRLMAVRVVLARRHGTGLPHGSWAALARDIGADPRNMRRAIERLTPKGREYLTRCEALLGLAHDTDTEETS